MKEAQYNNEESVREGRAGTKELIELNEDIRLAIDFLKEYIFSIINVLRALVQVSRY